MAPTQSEFREVIRASREDVWEVLFSQYGDIHIHNPTMQASHYMHGAQKGELGCLRHCDFSDTLFLEEKIAEFDENTSVTVVATLHNLPFLKEMSATYQLSDMGDGATEVKMTSYASTSPGFMIYLMKGQLGKSLAKHLFGMRYYIETGETVSMDDYDDVFKRYTSSPST